MAVKLPLDTMTVEEKLDLIEVLWADLSKSPDDIPSPAWHKEELDEIQARLDRGEEKIYTFEEVAERMRRLYR